MIGRTIGKYRIVEALGRGGMGTVYKALDETLDRDVAIKVLNADLLDTDGVKRFRAEAVTLAKLNHPSIAQVYDLTRDGEDVLMVMELVPGDTLEKIITRDGAMTLHRTVTVLASVLEALQHAHQAGIVHRDLKPANVMVTPAGQVKVMDFGIARVQGAAHLTHSGFMMGTPAYMSPEQVRGDDVDARTDLYAVGIVLYRMVTGQLPFKADTAVAMIHKQLNDQHTPSRQFRTDLPAWFDDVLDRALAKDPARRFQTADDLRLALSGHASPDQLVATMPPTPTPRALAVPLTVPLPAGPSAAAPAKASPSGTTTVTLQKRHIAGGAALIGVIAAAVAIAAFLALRDKTPSQGQAQVVTNAPSTPTAAPSAPGSSTPAAAASSPAVAPPAITPPAITVVAESAAKTPPASRPPAARRPGAAAPATAPVTTAAANTGAAQPLASAPAPSIETPAVSPRAGTRLDPPISFGDVKIAVPEGDKVKEYEVALKFQDGRIWASSSRNQQVSTSMPYDSLISATYSQSKHPRWKQGLGVAVAAGVFSAPIFFMKSTAHWLTLQSKETFLVLRLDKNNVNVILPALESRTGITVERQRGDK